MALLNEEAERCRTYLMPFHRQWYINISAVLGAQSTSAEAIARSLLNTARRPAHRVNHKSNLLRGAVNRLVGYLSRSDPEPEFIAADVSDPFQVDMARGARRWLDWNFEYDGYREKEQAALSWAVTTGWGILKAPWDPRGGPLTSAIDDDTGETLRDPQTNQELLDEEGKPILFPTGIPHTAVIPSFHVVYNIAARNSDEVKLVGEKSWLSRATIDSYWPGVWDRIGLVTEPQYSGQQSWYERQVQMTIGPQGAFAGPMQDSREEGATVVQMFVAPYYLSPQRYPKKFYEKGCFAVFCQGKFIELRANPCMELRGANPRRDWHPYTFITCYDVPGRLIGQGLPDNGIPVNDAIDFVISRLRETQRTMGQPKWFVPNGCGVTKAMLGPESGEKVPYNPSVGKPEAWQPTPMPAYIFDLLGKLEEHFDRVCSQPPMMRGSAQGQVRSGLGVQLLQEQALTEFTPMVNRLTYARQRHWRQLLLREIQYAKVPRRVQYRTQNGDWEQDTFLATQMAPDFSLRIRPGSEMPVNKAVIMSEIDRRVAWGQLQPAMFPAHSEAIDRALGTSTPVVMPDNIEENARQARYENLLICEGQYVPVKPHEKHDVHNNEHWRFMQTQRFREMCKADPTLEGRMLNHIGRHHGVIQAVAMGALIPQPIIPFEDFEGQAPGAGQQMAGGIMAKTGAQYGTNRGASLPTDRGANESRHSVSPQGERMLDGGGGETQGLPPAGEQTGQA